MIPKNWIDTYEEETIICPYCGEKVDAYDLCDYIDADNEPIECSCCDKKFFVVGQTKHTFTTYRADKDGNPDEYWDDAEDNDDLEEEE